MRRKDVLEQGAAAVVAGAADFCSLIAMMFVMTTGEGLILKFFLELTKALYISLHFQLSAQGDKSILLVF